MHGEPPMAHRLLPVELEQSEEKQFGRAAGWCYRSGYSSGGKMVSIINKIQMSEGSMKEGGLGSRLLIPTPSQGQSDDSATLRAYFTTYQRLKKEQNTLTNQLAIIERERQELQDRLEAMRREQEEKRKRHRRTAGEISRDFVCPLPDCQRKYGSEGSLLQHIKIKHAGFYNSEDYEAMLLSKHKKNKERLIAYSLSNPK